MIGLDAINAREQIIRKRKNDVSFDFAIIWNVQK